MKTVPLTLIALMLGVVPGAAQTTEPEPERLKDRGPGVATSMFGTYVRKGELLVYPFFEWYADRNFEYTPGELGVRADGEYRGRYRGSEGLLFLGYGLTNNLAVEFEAAVISAELTKSPSDVSPVPPRVRESGLGDVEMQVRWRIAEEQVTRPEVFTYFETVFPFQRDRRLIGTPDWEYKIGLGFTRGLSWGTMTFRAAADYTREERKWDAGEYAIEYPKAAVADVACRRRARGQSAR